MYMYIFILPFISSPFILFQGVLPPLLMSSCVHFEIACLKQGWGSDQYPSQLRTFIWFWFCGVVFVFVFLFYMCTQLKKLFMLGLK